MRKFFLHFLVPFLIFSRTYYISNSDISHGHNDLRPDELNTVTGISESSGDSILFKCGERFYSSIDQTGKHSGIVYFGSYGDTLSGKPVLDGSRCSFYFNAEDWKNFEIMNGSRIFKKYLPDLTEPVNVFSGRQRLVPAREPDPDDEIVSGRKNSFKGFFMIDSVDNAEPHKVFFDKNNISDWSGAEIVLKTRLWQYEVRNVRSCDGRFEMAEPCVNNITKNWGYFIQRHIRALDRKGEWFFDGETHILYFLPYSDNCRMSVTGSDEESGYGLSIKNKNNITIEDLRFENYKYGILLEKAEDIHIKNNEFENCLFGITNLKTYLDGCLIERNIIKNMSSYGIRIIGNDIVVRDNNIDSVGIFLGERNRGYINLVGIEIYGKENSVIGNSVSNTGYCGIRFFGSGSVSVEDNRFENNMLMMADGGAIYTWHYLEGVHNKIIRKNRVINAYGNADGTTGSYFGSNGIYLDELSLHFRVDSNSVENCGGGIYIQNSRSDTIVNNYVIGSNNSCLHINHAGSILNGGRLNSSNDPDFDPDTLSCITEPYIWDKNEKLLYYKNKRTGTVYIKPGNNLITENNFIPSEDKYTFIFRTWQHIDNSMLELLTGVKDFFRENVTSDNLINTSIEIIGGNVKDHYDQGNYYDNIQNSFDKTVYTYLKNIHIYIGHGNKYVIEK